MTVREKLQEVVIQETLDTPNVAAAFERLWDETLADDDIDQEEYNRMLFAMFRGLYAAVLELADHVERLESRR